MGCSRENRQGPTQQRRSTRFGAATFLALAALVLLPSHAAFSWGKVTNMLRGRAPQTETELHYGSHDAPVISPSQAVAANPFSMPNAKKEGPRDFYLFIKDYDWSLQYRVGLTSSDGKHLDNEAPLKLTWVKLNKAIRSRDELSKATAQELFRWDEMEPVKHKGFMYHVKNAFDDSVEAVIKFFEDKGIVLRVTPEAGIQLLFGQHPAKPAPPEAPSQAITHCWVETGGMPWAPTMTRMTFYEGASTVFELEG